MSTLQPPANQRLKLTGAVIFRDVLLVCDEMGLIGKELFAIVMDCGTLVHRLLSVLKAMSNADTDDFEFLDEAEWRVVSYDDQHLYDMRPATVFFGGERVPMVESWKSAPQIVRNLAAPPPFYFSFQPDDLALLVLPDEDIRSLVWECPDFRHWYQSRGSPLQLLTIGECVRM